jgi:hypothetical protein
MMAKKKLVFGYRYPYFPNFETKMAGNNPMACLVEADCILNFIGFHRLSTME